MEPSYRWVIVGAGALMTCVAIGAMFSLAVFLEPMSTGTGWSRTGISSAMTLNFIVMGLGAFGWGAVSDRFGTRIVVLIGAVLLGLALVLASRAASLIEFQITYGILVGLAASAFFTPMIAATTAWFEDNRSLAVSLVSAGMGVAPMTISPFARWLISAYDWRTAMLVIGIGASVGVARFVETLLFNLVATDNTMVALAAVALAAAAGVAGYLPARRAARVDPMVALREN